MKSKTKYTDEPMGKPRVIKDFLPPPSRLAMREDTVKVTLSLSRAGVDFFKTQAKAHGTSYQRMIRRLLDLYASQYRGKGQRVGPQRDNDLEREHRLGYDAHPVNRGEFSVWQKEQKWGDGPRTAWKRGPSRKRGRDKK
jgi:hypothetical protein